MNKNSDRVMVILMLFFIVLAAACIPLIIKGQQNYADAMQVYPATHSIQVVVQAILLACAVLSLVAIAISATKPLAKRQPLLIRVMAVNAGNLTVTLIGFVATMHYVVTHHGLSGNGTFGALGMATFVAALIAFIGAMILHNISLTVQLRKTTLKQEHDDERSEMNS